MTINENGFQADSFTEILESLSDQLKAIYGQDIDLSQDAPDGQYVAIDAKVISDLQDLALYIYNSFDPDFSQGVQLDRLLKLLARTRIPAKKSSLDVNITVSETVTLDIDYTITDDLGQNWIIQNSQEVTTGTTLVTFLSENYGTITLDSNATFEQETIVTQVTALDNPSSAVVGRDEETDQQLKTRRNNILEVNAYSTIGGIVGKILTLDGVDDCIAYENKTDVYDATLDLNAHTYWLIVKGGAVDGIIETISKYKTGGADTKGDVTDTWIETFTRSNGTTREYIHEMNFDRPTETEIYINVDVTKRNATDVIDTQAIKNVLTALDFNIAQNLTVTEMYSYIYQAGTNFIANNLELSKDNITFTSSLLEADYDEEFIISADNITITEV